MLAHRILEYEKQTQIRFLTSRLSRLECRVHPLRHNRPTMLEKYDAFFATEEITLIEVTADVVEKATEIRARYQFKTPDAIHMASAILTNTSAFLTSDPVFARCKEMTVDVLKPNLNSALVAC